MLDKNYYFIFLLHCGLFSLEAGTLVAHVVSGLIFISGYSGDECDYIECAAVYLCMQLFSVHPR